MAPAPGSRRRPAARAGSALAAALLLVGSGGCAAPEAGLPPRAQTLRIALRADPGSLDPLVAHSNIARQVAGQIYEPLVHLDSSLRPVPRLAVAWGRESGGRAWRFRLRPGVRWHDGVELDSGDVAATLGRALDPLTPSLDLKALLAGAGAAETPGPLEVRVPFDPPASSSLLPWQRLSILKAGASSGETLARQPSGTGPYRLSAWRRDEWILLERHAAWWGGEPPIRYLLFRILPDPLTISHALERGEVDIATARAADRERASRPGSPFRVLEFEPAAVYVVVWNQRPPGSPFADAQVRRTLTLTFNRGAFASQVRRGLARVAATLYPPLWRRGRAGVEPLPHDPAQAAHLLEEAGWRDAGADGWRERAGRRLSFPVLFVADDDIRRDAALLLQSDLAGVGVEARPERVDALSLVRRLRSHDFSAAVHGWTLDPEPRAYDFLHSSQAEGGLNYGGHSDPILDALLEEEAAAADERARSRVGLEIEERLREQAPLLFICFPVGLVGVSRRVEGLEVGPLGLLSEFPGPARWRLREGGEDSEGAY